MSVTQIGIIGMIGVILASLFKSEKAEYGIYISIGISMILFYYILNRLSAFNDVFQTIRSYIQLDDTYLNTIIKMIGITYIAEFAACICKDAGYQSIATQIELFAKLSILSLSLPVMLALLQTIKSFLS